MTLADYLNKQAGISDVFENLGNKALDTSELVLLAAPAVAGVTAGAIHSIATSPSGKFDTTQKALVAAELDEALAEMERRKKLALLRDKMKKVTGRGERTLHI